jgi:CO/xanthine dehydrogenase FAD-binding subunit
MDEYLRPTSLNAALAALAEVPRVILAGGTDHFPRQGAMPQAAPVLDISALPGLRGIERRMGGWFIPCLTTWSDLVSWQLPPDFNALRQAARQVGGVQIQNAGTLLGNLCNASPAADGVPCLLALDASVELASLKGRRVVPLADFILGPRQTALRADELAIGLHIPEGGGVSRFEKLGARAYLVISIAMVAAWARIERGRIIRARIAIGACGPRAILLPELAASLVGQKPERAIITPDYFYALTPIDDVRAPAEYRRHAAVELTRRAVAALAQAGVVAA